MSFQVGIHFLGGTVFFQVGLCTSANYVFYRYHRKNSEDEFVKNLRPTLKKIKNRNKHIIICGDFNYDLSKSEHNEQEQIQGF